MRPKAKALGYLICGDVRESMLALESMLAVKSMLVVGGACDLSEAVSLSR